jgi:6-phosphogluconate dehydrogenase
METKSNPGNCDIGMVGLGVMGRNLLLNMADHGFAVAGYDKDPAKVEALRQEAKDSAIRAAGDIAGFVAQLRRPRAIMMLVPAGPPVDAVINDLRPHLEAGDLIIDAGNSYFKDTERRARDLTAQGLQFLGIGISGGESGARHGPSIMPGGPPAAYERVRAILEAAAAKVGADPCVTYLGPGSAGHFVKMVHNGIEYAVMQMLAEAYDLMKRSLGMTDDEIANTYQAWNQGPLNGYLVEITSQIFRRPDEKTGNRLVDQIVGVAAQNGTGKWTSESAMDLQVTTPTIDVSVAIRSLSELTEERAKASAVLPRAIRPWTGDRPAQLRQLEGALYCGLVIAYAQGLAVLQAAAAKFGYGFKLEAVARIWRGGCIIRAALLEDIRGAFLAQPGLTNLLLDPGLARKVLAQDESLRQVAAAAAGAGVPVPGLMASLGYLDSYRSAWLPANLIQAQRDYFGAHTYERVDAKGSFHTEWDNPANR